MSDAGDDPGYGGREVALVTRHEKSAVIGPLLRDALGARLVVIDDIDTDALGTFTREVPRAGTQREAARHKATLALSRGHTLGLGSEGAFVPGPFGFGAFNVELVVFVDAGRGIEVVGQAAEPALHVHGTAADLAALDKLARRAGFPEHGLVVRADDERGGCVRKGLRTPDALEQAFVEACAASRTGHAFVENDLRAHQHPGRMQTIARATRDLIERLGTPCPACASPGFGVSGKKTGRPCGACGTPTTEPIADELSCVRCDHRALRPLPGPAFADPGRCDLCNP